MMYNREDERYRDNYENTDADEYISVWDAAEIWLSNGKDEDYMFDYTVEELENAI